MGNSKEVASWKKHIKAKKKREEAIKTAEHAAKKSREGWVGLKERGKGDGGHQAQISCD